MIRFVDYNNDKKEACYSFCAVSENNQCAERVYGHCPFAGAIPAVVCQCGIKKMVMYGCAKKEWEEKENEAE